MQNTIAPLLTYFFAITVLALVDIWLYRLMGRSVMLRDKRKTRCNKIGRRAHAWISTTTIVILLLVSYTVPDDKVYVIMDWMLRLVAFSATVIGILLIPAVTMIICEYFALKKKKGKCLTWMYHQPFFGFFQIVLIYIIVSWTINTIGISFLMTAMIQFTG